MLKNKKHIAILIALSVIALAIGVLMFTSAESGPMSMSEDAKKIQENRVYDDTINYYNTVCSGISDVNDSARKVLDVSETSIGTSPDEAKKAYLSSLDELSDTTKKTQENFAHVNADVDNVEIGNNTHVVYKGALDPTLDSLTETANKVETQRDLIANINVEDTDHAGDAYSQTLSTIADNNSKVSGSLSDVLGKAVILSKPTVEKLKTDSACKSILGGPMSDEKYKDTTVDGLVDLKKRFYNSYDELGQATFQLSQLNLFSGGHDEEVTRLMLDNLDVAEKKARAASSTLKNWTNLYPTDDPQHEVAENHTDIRDRARDAYANLADEIQSLREDIDSSESQDMDTLGNIYKDHADSLKHAQIAAERAHARSNLDFMPPTKPTSDAIAKLDDPSRGNADKQVVDHYMSLVHHRKDVLDEVQILSDNASNLEGADINQAVTTLTTDINGIADAVKTDGLSEEDTHTVQSHVETLRNQAATLQSLDTAAVNDQLSDIMDTVSDAERSIFDIYARAIDDFDTKNMPTRQSIEKEVAKLE